MISGTYTKKKGRLDEDCPGEKMESKYGESTMIRGIMCFKGQNKANQLDVKLDFGYGTIRQ